MPSVRYSIDASGATRGAQQWAAATDRIVAEAQRAARAVEQMDRAVRGVGQGNVGREFERMAGQFQRIPNAVRPAVQQVGAFSVAMRDMSSASALAFGPLSGLGSRFTAVGSLASRSTLALGGTIAAITGLGVAFGGSVKAAANFEEGMLRVAKVTNASGSQLKTMSSDILRLSSTLGVPTAELTKIAERGAQMGRDFLKTSADLATFTEQVAILTRTTNLSAEDAAASLGRFMQLTHSSAASVKGYAAALVDVGNKFNATESEILKIAEELSRAGTAFNVGGNQILALGAALASTGEHAERSATAVSQTLVRITQAATGGGDQLKHFADAVGLSVDKFKEMSRTNIGDIFTRLLQSLKDAGPQASGILKELHIGSERNVKVFLSLAQNLDRFRGALADVNSQLANPTAAMAEFAKLQEGTNAQFEKAGVNLQNLATILGGAFLPSINSTLQSTNAFLLLLQGIEPPAQQASANLRATADAAKALADNLPLVGVAVGTAMLPFAPAAAAVLGLAAAFGQLYKMMNAPATAPVIATVSAHAESAEQALAGLRDEMTNVATATNQSTAATGQGAGAYNQYAGAIEKALSGMDREIAVKKALATEGTAAAAAQKVINELEKQGVPASEIDKVRGAIEAKAKALTGYGASARASAKEAKDAAKAFETFDEGVAAVIRDLEKDIKLTGLTDSQKQVVEFTTKIEERGAKAIEAGADEVKIREAVNAAIARGIPLVKQSAAAKAREFNSQTLQSLQRQVELRHIEIEQGAAAARVQQIINDATDKGITLKDEEVSQYRKLSEELDGLRDKSTVVADAFEDMIAGIAAGTQELSLDGITDAFKAAFAGSVKEKLQFDKIFEGNMLDLGGSVLSSVGGAFQSVFSLASSLFGGGGGGGGFVGPLLENGTIGTGGGTPGLLGFGGGGGLGILGNIALNSGGFFAQSNPGLSLGLSGLSVLNSGLQIATGSGIIGSLFGTGASSATLGSLIGVADAAGSQGGLLGSLLGTSVGTIGAVAGGVTGAASGIYSGYQLGAGGLSSGQKAASSAAVVAGGVAVYAALSYLNVIPVIGTIIYAILVAIAALVGALLKHTPMAAGVLRKQAESILDSTKTFQELQKSLGDISESNGNYKKGSKEGVNTYGSGSVRINQQTGIDTARDRGFSEDAIRNVRAFAGVFAADFFATSTLVRDGNPLLMMAAQQSQVLSEFFSRAKMDTEDYGAFTAEQLRKAFDDMGVDVIDAMGLINTLSKTYNKVLAQQTNPKLPEDQKQLFGVNVAESIRGAGAIFESDTEKIPPGVHIAALAIQTLEKDGQKAFSTLNGASSDFFVKLEDDAENFDKVVNDLLQQGFEINTDEFEARLNAVIQSAKLINGAAPDLFNAATFEQGFSAVIGKLKEDIKSKLGSGFIGQLFDKTNIAAAFEPVYALLDRMDEFDLSNPSGLSAFMQELAPAIAQGRANLEDYIPILKQMYDQWKDIEKQVDEALAPTDAEQMADAIATSFNGLGSLISDAIQAGVAILNSGGTFDEAMKAFNSRFGAGLQTALKTAVFNAILDTAIIQPMIARYQPAFAFVAQAGLAFGFGDPRVIEAWNLLMGQIESDVANVGPLLLQAATRSEGLDHGLTKFFAKMQADIDEINRNMASTFTSTISGAITEAMKTGKAVDLDDLRENLHATIYEAVVNAMVEAMVSAAIIQGGLAPLLEQLRVMSADAWKDGMLSLDEKNGLAALITRIGKAGIELSDVIIAGLGPILELIGGLPGVNTGGSSGGRGKGHYESQGGDIVWVPDYDRELPGRQPPTNTTGGNPDNVPVATTGGNPDAGKTSETAEEKWASAMSNVTDGMLAMAKGMGTIGSALDTDVRGDMLTLGLGLGTLGDAAKRLGDLLDTLQPKPAPTTGDTGGDTVPGHAAGGSFRVGQESMFITGERGPELFIAHRNGYEVIPLSGSAASAMLSGGTTGFASGTRNSPPEYHLPPDPQPTGGSGGRKGPDLAPGGPRSPLPSNPTDRGTPGWRPTKVPPPPGQHPGSTGVGQVAVEVTLNLDDAIRDFLQGGSLKDFQDALDEASKKAVMDGLIKGMLESGPIKTAIDKFNKQMGDAVEKAMRDGVIDAQEQADLNALSEKLAGGIETATKQMQPMVEAVGKAFGVGVAGSVNTDVKSALEEAFKDFASTGDLEAARDAIRSAFADATINGIVEALLAEGPIADAIENASTSFGDAMRDALADGVISADEADRLQQLGAQLGTDLETAFTGLDPVITGLFDGMREKATAAMQEAGNLISGSLKGLLNDPETLNFKTFSEHLRQSIYQSVAGGLIDAFIDAALIQGALAPMLAAIQAIFEAIGKHQISIAEANGAIATQIALMLDVLKDPAFKAAIDTLLKGVTDIGKQLNAFPDAAKDAQGAATGVSDAVAQAQEDVCAGKCGLKEETVNLGQTVLDASGRIGDIEDIVFRAVGGDGAAAAGGLPSTYGGGNGTYGMPHWRRQFVGPDGGNGGRGSYDPDADWGRGYDWQPDWSGPGGWQPRKMATGGIVTDPTFALIGEAGPEAVIPLGQLGDGADLAALVEEMRDEIKELRAALAEQPVVVNADVSIDETTVIKVMAKAKRSAKAAGFEGL